MRFVTGLCAATLLLGCQQLLGIETGEPLVDAGGAPPAGGGGTASQGGAGAGADGGGGAATGGGATTPPEPELLFSGRSNPNSIALDGSYLYWTESGGSATVYRAAFGSADVEELQQAGVNATASIVLTLSHVVLLFEAAPCSPPAGGRNVSIYRKNKDGSGAPEPLFSGCAANAHIASVGQQHAFFVSTTSGNEIWRGDDTSTGVWKDVPLPISALAMNNSDVFTSDIDGIMSHKVDTSASVNTSHQAQNLVAGLDTVWWYDTDANVFRQPIGFGERSLGFVPQIADIAVADGELFYVSGGVTGTGIVGIADVPGGNARPLAESLTQPRSIAVDATHVYWTDSGVSDNEGAIYRLVR